MSSSKSCAFTSRTLLGDKPRFQYERMVTDIAPFINKHTQRSSEAIPLMTEGRRRRQGGERCLKIMMDCRVRFYFVLSESAEKALEGRGQAIEPERRSVYVM